MVTGEEIGQVAVFADLEPAQRDWLFAFVHQYLREQA
jgi:hypothetical protein